MTETLDCINDYYNDKYKVAKDLSHDMFVIVDYGYYFNQGFVYDVNNTEVFDEQSIEWFKNSVYYDEKNTNIIPVKISVMS